MASEPNPVPSIAAPDAQTVLDYLTTSVITLDSAMRINYLNQSAETLTGISRLRAQGMLLSALFENVDEIETLCARALEVKGSVEIREIVLVPLTDPGSRLEVDVTAVPFDVCLGIVVEIRNVANRLRIKRDKAMASQNSVSRTIVRQLAHEIKNPLGGLRGAAQLLARRLPSADLKEYTDVIIHEADRLVELVDSMLGPNRPTHRKAMNIHLVLDHVNKLITAEAKGDARVVCDFDPSLPDVLLDKDQMTQAVLNLARNALQAVGDNGVVVLRSRVESGFVIGEHRHATVARIDVEDSGPGIPEELREQIFYPLVTGRIDGVGLGLAITLELVKRHEGLIKLHTGQPTTFSIYLPLVDTRALQ